MLFRCCCSLYQLFQVTLYLQSSQWSRGFHCFKLLRSLPVIHTAAAFLIEIFSNGVSADKAFHLLFMTRWHCCLLRSGNSYHAKSDDYTQSDPHFHLVSSVGRAPLYFMTFYDFASPVIILSHVVTQVLADAVSRLVVDKFSDLTDNFTSPHARRKVLAGVVMTTGNSFLFFFPSQIVASENVQPSSTKMLGACSMWRSRLQHQILTGFGYCDTAAQHLHRVKWLKRGLLSSTRCVSAHCASAGTRFASIVLFLRCDCDAFVFLCKILKTAPLWTQLFLHTCEVSLEFKSQWLELKAQPH